MEQRLGGNAADVEAGTAEGLVFLDHRHLHAKLCRADRADIAAGAGADDSEIVGHGNHSLLFTAPLWEEVDPIGISIHRMRDLSRRGRGEESATNPAPAAP